MQLSIQVVSVGGQPQSQGQAAQFSEPGGTLGRDEGCTLCLPDEACRISRVQAELSGTGGRWTLRNVGSANPIGHNHRAVEPGQLVALQHGDVLQVGDYALEVSLKVRMDARLQRDLLADLPPPSQPAALSVQPAELPSLTAQTLRTPLRDMRLLLAPSDVLRGAVDFSTLEGGLSLAEPMSFRSLTADEPVDDSAATHPGALDEPFSLALALPPDAPSHDPANTNAVVDAEKWWAAFCEGAGMGRPTGQGMDLDVMREIGQLLCQCVGGLRALLAAHADEPLVAAQLATNPLCAATDTSAVLQQLLQRPLPPGQPGARLAVQGVLDALLHDAPRNPDPVDAP